MNEIKMNPIGKIVTENNEMKIILSPEYRAGLKGLSGYSHVQVLWWADGCDNGSVRATLIDLKPYTPSIDRVEHSTCPEWCSHWPKSYEESISFDWEKEFNF